MTDLKLYLFGTPRLEYSGTPIKLERRKALALAGYLALSQRPQSREVVASLLWPELDEAHARSALRSTLRALTAPVPFEWLEADRTTLRLKSDQLWVDANSFSSLLTQRCPQGHSADTVCDACADSNHEAAALYSDDFMAGYHLDGCTDFEDWKRIQQEWLRREFADIQRRLSFYHAESQRFEQAIKHAHRWLAVDSLHEPAHRQLMRLYALHGQRSEALRQYKQCVDVLDVELATPPEAETTQLYQAIQENRPTGDFHSESSKADFSSIMPPLPSLMIGREAALNEMKLRLGMHQAEMRSTTVIQGWPGVGKSSLVAMMAHDAEITQQFPDGILWASLGENPGIFNELSLWADALKLSDFGRVRKIEEISAQLTAALHDKRVLLIIDDVWQTEHAQPFRVGGQFCAMVMTSRLNDVATALAPTAYDLYRLPVLSDGAGLELLQRLTPETVRQHPDDSRELVHDLEGLPLAIHVAGRLLHSEAHLGWGVRELLTELRTGAGILQAQAPSDMVSVGRDASPTVAALLKRSTDLLDEETRQRFALLGLFVPKPATFDLDAMAVAWDVDDPRPTARHLVNRGLLEPVSGGRFQLHALLVLQAQSMLEAESNRL